jgi:hypothetical protein
VGNGAKLVVMTCGIPVGWWLAGLGGALGGLVAGEVVKYGVSLYFTGREGLRPLWLDLRSTAPVVWTSAAGLAAAAVGSALHLPLVATLLLAGGVCALAWGPSVYGALRMMRGAPAHE